MLRAFSFGEESGLDLAMRIKQRDHAAMLANGWDVGGRWDQHIHREGQEGIDRIVQGQETGEYFMVLGPKVRNLSPPRSNREDS